ncbi:hypothetical protein KEJ27_05470 [Candidatus Bathyarchaeota archaeon]|nr:hypothetical protein [Candidatus Bathyarchaeota archaeon]
MDFLKTVFWIGFAVLVSGVAIAVIPFKEEIVASNYMIEISNWAVSWYYIPLEPTEEGFTGSFLRNSTFEPTFFHNWGREPIILELPGAQWGGFQTNIGFIAKAKLYTPIDGYVWFEVVSGDGVRLYIDGKLIIDKWSVIEEWQGANSGRVTVEVKAGEHELELWWYQWVGDAIAAFDTDRKVMVVENKSDPIAGMGISCTGVALIFLAKIRTPSKSKKS